jgi:hypothetical protein
MWSLLLCVPLMVPDCQCLAQLGPSLKKIQRVRVKWKSILVYSIVVAMRRNNRNNVLDEGRLRDWNTARFFWIFCVRLDISISVLQRYYTSICNGSLSYGNVFETLNALDGFTSINYQRSTFTSLKFSTLLWHR